MGKITFEYAGGKLEFEKDDKLILEILAAHRKQLITEQSITAAELEVSIIKRRVEQENCMIGDCQVRGRFRCGKDCGRYKSPEQPSAEKQDSIIKRMGEQVNCMIGDCNHRGRFWCGKECSKYFPRKSKVDPYAEEQDSILKKLAEYTNRMPRVGKPKEALAHPTEG